MALPRLNNVIDLIAETPIVKQAIAERNAAEALRRRTMIGELRRLEREMQKAYPELDAAVQAAIAAVTKADAAALAARRQLDVAAGAKAQAAYRFTSAHDRLEAELRGSSSPAIREFISAMLDELDPTQRAVAWATEHTHNPVTGRARRSAGCAAEVAHSARP
jgi:hypothetical protein